MASFTDAIDQLVFVLQNDAALTAYCQATWGRQLQIKKTYKQRSEIHMNDLPCILITRPSVTKSFQVGARDGIHSVNLYCGFLQNDRRKALQEFIAFEEKLDDALLANHTLNGTVINVDPKSSVNDEGKFHPIYFFIAEVNISHRR